MVAPKPAFIALLAGAITGVAAWKDQGESFTASLPNVAFNATYYPAGALWRGRLSQHPKHDVLAAMVDWVENEKAPTDIIAAKYNNNNATQGVQFTRKFCPYPQKARSTGGDQNSFESFVCA
ncbi:hypothetical protein NCC49_001165 [Naganishia albida]|nr:hypothetical protein NCC49_001165 [Naganishia albida]